MYTIVYDEIENLDVPSEIKQSLLDDKEFSHIHEIDHTTYFILNYPKNSNLLNVICLSHNLQDDFQIYVKKDTEHSFEEVNDISKLLFSILDMYENFIMEIDRNLTIYEEMLDELVTKKYITKLFNDKKELIEYGSAIDSIHEVLTYIITEKPEGVYTEEMSPLFTTLQIEINQINKKMDITVQKIDSMQQISESMYSNKLTQTMKYLTLITLLFSAPNFLTSLYNTNLIPKVVLEYVIPIFLGLNFILTIITVYNLIKESK